MAVRHRPKSLGQPSAGPPGVRECGDGRMGRWVFQEVLGVRPLMKQKLNGEVHF